MVLALFLILQSCKSGFDSPQSESEWQHKEEEKLASLKAAFRSPETKAEADAQSTAVAIQRDRDVYEHLVGTSTEAFEGLTLGKGNAEVLKDLEGSVNQRNYPMVGKDQGGLDIPYVAPLLEIDGANALPIDVNSLPYPIEGYDEGNMSPFMETPEDLFQRNTEQLLDVTVPTTVIPDVPKISPTQGITMNGGNLSSPLPDQSKSVLTNNISGRSGG